MCVVGGRSARCIRGRQSKTGAPAEGPTVIGVLKTWELVQSRAVFLEKLGRIRATRPRAARFGGAAHVGPRLPRCPFLGSE